MNDLLRAPITIVWILLTLITCLSWWLGVTFGHVGIEASKTTVALLTIAFFKVHLVIQYFMEVREGPMALRVISRVWIIGAFGTVMGAYLLY